jgi:glutaminyl-peptide cyclotransferase
MSGATCGLCRTGGRALLLVSVLTLVPLAGCREQKADATAGRNTNVPATSTSTSPTNTGGSTVAKSEFDAGRAFEHVRRQVAFGPRPAGSPALALTRKYLVTELTSFGLKVTEEAFTATTPTGKVDMVNVIAELPGESPQIVVLGSHYDTKRMANFVGANDAGSSTGALLEIARVLAESARTKKPELTLQFVFFDGEEAVIEWSDEDSLYGSRHFVDARQKAGTMASIRGMVLLDMIGDRDLVIAKEGHSTATLTDAIWSTAASLGYAKHFVSEKHWIDDDHVPFLTSGVASVDIIDFQYGTSREKYGDGGPTNAYWHTPDDTLDKVSAESLKVVGDTVIASLPAIFALVRR